jgi:hypothetical protein
MAPPPWTLRALEGVVDALPQPAGLLLGAVNDTGRAITLLGATPVAAAASSTEITTSAAEVMDLLPQGAHVVGCYGCATPPPLAAHGCPAVGAAGPGALTLGGAAAAVEAVAAGPGVLSVPGFVTVRCHCSVVLRVTAPAAGPTPEALARAFAEVQQQLAGPSVVFAAEAK